VDRVTRSGADDAQARADVLNFFEFDPVSGEDLTELVEVGPAGEITTWAWVTVPHDKHPLDQPFAWALLKLDRTPSGKPCFAHQVKRCRGACVGLETVAEHTERLREALASTALVPWPFDGAIAFREGRVFHVVDGWAYLGMVAHLDEAKQLAVTTRPFDADVYRLLVKRIGAMEVVRL
jgi:hypothetical protein